MTKSNSSDSNLNKQPTPEVKPHVQELGCTPIPTLTTSYASRIFRHTFYYDGGYVMAGAFQQPALKGGMGALPEEERKLLEQIVKDADVE